MVQTFGWNLRDIDETSMESLLPFMARYGKKDSSPQLPQKGEEEKTRLVYADEVDWL